MNDASQKQRRTESFDIRFTDQLVEGWAFSVHSAFKDQLDILYLEYVDKEKTKELRKVQPIGDDGKPPKVMRSAWSRGVPPLLRFDAGHTFYDPPSAKNMAWGAALQVLKRTVQVVEAKPDEQPGKGGWVKIKLVYYNDGAAVAADEHTMSQAEFEVFLRLGQLPALPVLSSYP